MHASSAIVRTALLETTGRFLVHCSFGKDRTEILLALGMAREVVLEDYLLTNQVLDLDDYMTSVRKRGYGRR